jgi:nucleoside-diphosphate-sugar epimerase
MKNILITGGAGFIGYGLSENLVNKGFNVTILDNLSKKIHSNRDKYNYLKKITKFIIGDIRHNFADISKANSILNFSNKTLFKDGLQKFVSWVNDQKINKDNYLDSYNELEQKGFIK